MSSSFKGLDLFGSGPHRFAWGRQGQVIWVDAAHGVPSPYTFATGLQELDIIVRGRLVANTEAGLQSLRAAIIAQLLHPPAPGTLIDHHGFSWPDMSFIRWEEADRTDRGRDVTLAYVATFRRFYFPEGEPGGGA
ncbi:MAG: hypothetical protein IT439_02700 [Phycisphaerales bacterium]|nr:hypothetical protein [Phycisphaerales bacterium]